MQISTRHWYAFSNLLLQGGKAGIGYEASFDAVAGQCFDLRLGIGSVAVLLDSLEVLVIAIGTFQRARLEVFQQHGAGAAEAHSPPLIS